MIFLCGISPDKAKFLQLRMPSICNPYLYVHSSIHKDTWGTFLCIMHTLLHLVWLCWCVCCLEELMTFSFMEARISFGWLTGYLDRMPYRRLNPFPCALLVRFSLSRGLLEIKRYWHRLYYISGNIRCWRIKLLLN